MPQGGIEDFRTERRTKLDGGLDTRSGPFSGADKTTRLENLSFLESGSLTKRLGGARKQLVNVYSVATGLQAPVLTAINDGAGTLPAATYTVGYALTSLATGAVIGASTTASVVVGGANNAIRIEIRPLNAGDGKLQASTEAAVDDPINGGFSATGFTVYALKAPDALTAQAGVTALAWDNTLVSQVTKLLSYTSSGAANPATVTQLPFRAIVYHPGIPGFIYWMAEQPMFAASSTDAPVRLTTAADRAGNATFFSRAGTKIQTVFFSNVLVAVDGMGKPKRQHWTGTASTSFFQNCGSTTPASASIGHSGVGGNPNGTYFYKTSYIFEYTTADGSKISFETNTDTGSNQLAVVNEAIDVTIPQTSEPNLKNIRLYRNTMGQTTQTFFVVDLAPGTLTYRDNSSDAQLLGTVRPQNEGGRVPNDPPPLGLYHLEIHLNRLFAVQMNYYKPNDKRIEALIPSNQVFFTKANTIDAWPGTFNVRLGNSQPVTGIKSTRGLLYIFKPNELGVLDGSDESNFSYRTIFTGVGAMENSIIEAGSMTYFWDEEKGPIALRGYTYDEIGVTSIQERWRTLRGSVVCRDAYYSKVNNEVRWVFTTYDTNPRNQAVPTTHREFRLYVPTGAWSEAYGATSGGQTDRFIMGSTLGQEASQTRFQMRDVFWGDFYGRLVKDDQVEYDLDPSVIAIPFQADFVFFWGDNPEMVKRFRYIFLLFRMGTTVADTLNIRAMYLSAQVLTLVRALTAADATGKDRMIRSDVPQSLVSSVSEDRGLVVSIDGSAKSGPLRLKELAVKYMDMSDLRDAP